MKSAESKTTASAQHLSKSERQQQPFFQRERAGSALDNGQPSFFSPNGSVGLQPGPFFGKPTVQTKLRVGPPGDKYEQEADRTADQVMQRLAENENGNGNKQLISNAQSGLQRRPIFESEAAPEVQAKSLNGHTLHVPQVQKKCAECEQEEDLEEMEAPGKEEGLKRKPIFDSATPPPEELGEGVQRKNVASAGNSALQLNCADCAAEEDVSVQRQEATDGASTASDGLTSRLDSSKGSGSPLSKDTRAQMEGSFGTDFSGVRVHTDSSAAQMNKELRAQAFTHGTDIYFNSGKYDTDSNSGKHLLAHELTHTVQQKGGYAPSQRKIQRWPDWVSDAAGWVSDTASDAVGSVVEGAEWVGGQVADGARWVGGKVASGAEWVGEQISAAAQWIIDRIRSVIDSGQSYLNEKWESIQTFGRTCFDDIKNGFGDLIHFVTTPLSSIMSALSGMNADLLGSAWNLLKSGSDALWSGINAVINGVLQIGAGLWNTVSGFINGIFDTVSWLVDNAAFDLLPDSIKEEARSIVNRLRSLWNQVSSFWTDLWQRLTSTVQEILAAVRSIADNVIGYGIETVISMVRGLKEVYDYVTKFFADPRATIQPFLDQLAEKLNTEVPPQANNLGTELAQENSPGRSPQTSVNGSIQRDSVDGSEDRSTATLEEVGAGIRYYIAQAWAELNVRQMLWDTVVNTFWPPATIRAIANQFTQLWNDDWATTLDSLYTPRNFLEHPIDCLHDLWSNLLILLDFPLALWRTLNNVVALLMGYITIIVILVEAIIGGVAAVEVGVVPGLLAGAAAGLETVAALGEVLMASYLVAEGSTVIVILGRLFTARQVCEKRQVDILTSVASFVAMAVALSLQALMALLAELASLIANAIRGVAKGAPIAQPQPAGAGGQAIPAGAGGGQVIPAGSGGGQVIPLFPNGRAPVTPVARAAKLEGGVTQASYSDTLLEENESSVEGKNGSDANRECNSDIETAPLSGAPASANGTLQTSRKDRINPDACKEEKCELAYKWTRNNPTVPGNELLRYCEQKKNHFQKDGHHSWPKYLGGPQDQGQLLPVDHHVHMREFHGDQGRIGTTVSIHKHIETYLNSSRDYKNLLKGKSLTKLRSSKGNELLIEAMVIDDGAPLLRSRVKQQMMIYYGQYSAASEPPMPVSAYSVGLDKSENDIRQ